MDASDSDGQSAPPQQSGWHGTSGSDSSDRAAVSRHQPQTVQPQREAPPSAQPPPPSNPPNRPSQQSEPSQSSRSPSTTPLTPTTPKTPTTPTTPTTATATAVAGPSAPSARSKALKHVVGGGSSARLHARAPSSKTLLKAAAQHHHLHHATSTASAKLSQPAAQPPPTAAHRDLELSPPSLQELAAQFPFAAAPPPELVAAASAAASASHRRSTSTTEARLQQNNPASASTSSLLRRNASASALKRTRSHADVPRRTGGRPALKRSSSKKTAQIRFEIGTPEAADDEWVDAGSSTVIDHPHGAAAAVAQAVEVAETVETFESTETTETGSETEVSNGEVEPQPAAPSVPLRASSSTTRLLLPRTPSRGAPPMMSAETAAATRTHSSSDASSDHDQPAPATPPPAQRPAAPAPPSTSLAGGSGSDKEPMTSRFLTMGSHESSSAATAGASYYTHSTTSRPGTGVSRRRGGEDNRDRDLAGSAVTNVSGLASYHRRRRSIGGDTITNGNTDDDDDDDETPHVTATQPVGSSSNSNTAAAATTTTSTHPRRTRPPPAELSRTQQKLNLERASSSLDHSGRPHQGPAAAGPLLGGGGFGMHDPRIGKLMEKTGMEYYVVRRYQNPVTRSLARLADQPRQARGHWRIPSGASGVSAGASAGAGATMSSAAAPSTDRDRDMRRDMLHASVGPAGLPGLPRTRTFPAAAAPALHAEAGGRASARYQQSPLHEARLSGTSLDGRDDDTAALLRNLWDKSLYLGSSQD